MKYQFYDIVPNKMQAVKVIKPLKEHYKVKVKRMGGPSTTSTSSRGGHHERT